MWADTIDLDLGRWLVGVRPDSDATKHRLERLLAPCVASPGGRARTNYSVRAPGRWWNRADVELYEAGLRIMTDRSFDKVAHRLIGELSGIAADGPLPAGRTRVEARLLARGQRGVLVFGGARVSLDVPEAEIAVWRPVVDTEQRTVIVPPLLDGLGWSAAKVDPPPDRPDRLELVGVVGPPDHTGAPALAHVWFAGSGALDEWGMLLSTLDHEERVVAVHDYSAELTAAVTQLLA